MVSQRYLAGLSAEPSHGILEAAAICVTGSGTFLRVQRIAAEVLPCPVALHGSGTWATGNVQDIRLWISLSATLAQALLETLRKATDRLGISWHELLCAGLSEPYLILEPHEHGAFGLQLPLAALLAELTGISMAHAFGSRDFAAGGQGMPVVATADWILFHSPAEDRVVVHLGDIFWMHWLPRNGSWQQMRGAVVGPGLAWLTALAWALNFGRESSDRLGHLAVQGRVRHDLMARWQSHPALLRRNTRGISLSAFGYEWTQSTVQLARQRGWRGFDILCTAHHWLAILVADTLKQLIKDTDTACVIVTGHGQRNGFLWRLLEEKLVGLRVERSDVHGVPAEATQAIRSAILAGLLLDQEPANVPNLTGSSGPRMLGEWAPGSLSNWSRCLQWMTTGTDPQMWEEP
jgi:anhydro-N-acetylmuramic acid kinase